MHARIATLPAALLALVASALADAQTCAAPGAWPAQPDGSPALTADLCTLSDQVPQFCDFLDSSAKNDGIWQITLVAGFPATQIVVSGGGAGFNPVIFLYNGACASGSGCVASGDAGNPILLPGTAPGTYFLAASAAPSDAAMACGPITVNTNGWLPVTLQAFTID